MTPTFLDLILTTAPEDESASSRRGIRLGVPAGVVTAAVVLAVGGLAVATAVAGPAGVAEGTPIAVTTTPASSSPETSGPAVPRPPRVTVQVTSDVFGGLGFVIATDRLPAMAVVVVEPAGPGGPVRRSIRVTHPQQLVGLRELPGGPAVWRVKVGHAPLVSGWVDVTGIPAAPPPTPWPPPPPPKKPSKHGSRDHVAHGRRPALRASTTRQHPPRMFGRAVA